MKLCDRCKRGPGDEVCIETYRVGIQVQRGACSGDGPNGPVMDIELCEKCLRFVEADVDQALRVNIRRGFPT